MLFEFPDLSLPTGCSKLLLHSCCAPCSGEMILALKQNQIDFKILFYNPNIHPKREYLLRKEENQKFAQELGIEFIDLDYDKDNWFEQVQGLEFEPERGARCTLCFDIRFQVSAAYAVNNGYEVYTSSLGISRWKDFEQITSCGQKAAAEHPKLIYWDYNWRKKGGSDRMIKISKEYQFYQQQYCGCVYSLRDTNNFRKQKGREKITLGQDYYKH